MCLNDRIDLPDKIGSFAAGYWGPKIELVFLIYAFIVSILILWYLKEKNHWGTTILFKKIFNSFRTKWKVRYLY